MKKLLRDILEHQQAVLYFYGYVNALFYYTLKLLKDELQCLEKQYFILVKVFLWTWQSFMRPKLRRDVLESL